MSIGDIDFALSLGGFVAMMDLHIRNREQLANLRILDLHFDEVTRSMATAAEKIYAHAGMQFPAESRLRIAAWEEGNPQHAKGSFTYSLADYGFDEASLQRGFARYLTLMQRIFS